MYIYIYIWYCPNLVSVFSKIKKILLLLFSGLGKFNINRIVYGIQSEKSKKIWCKKHMYIYIYLLYYCIFTFLLLRSFNSVLFQLKHLLSASKSGVLWQPQKRLQAGHPLISTAWTCFLVASWYPSQHWCRSLLGPRKAEGSKNPPLKGGLYPQQGS